MASMSAIHILKATFIITITGFLAVVAIPIAKTQSLSYLSKFGYLDNEATNLTSEGDFENLENAVKKFQDFGGLEVTGELDNKTIQLMAAPRCGRKDNVIFSLHPRLKRYALQGSRWTVKALNYQISKYPKKLHKFDVDREVEKAFALWSEYTDLTFSSKFSRPVHIDIRFETIEHGDGTPFDGPGDILGHANYPLHGGDVHFDDAEHWTISSSLGINLFQVAAHQIGHSLGLSHSSVSRALMSPFYRGYDPTLKLHPDDIQGIQSLYGKKSPPGELAVGSGVPDARCGNDLLLCRDSRLDAIFNTDDGTTYAFQGDKYYRLMENAVADGYPKAISEGWPGLPSNIDAAFTYKNGKTYFFKGSKYWRYNGRVLDGEYPKEINEGFPRIPNNVDAAMVWGGNCQIYFFKGSKFWRFDPLKRPPVKSSYPKPLSNWEGIPDGIDAAFCHSNGYTYFFKGDKYFRFNDKKFSVDASKTPFPRLTAHWWFGCKKL